MNAILIALLLLPGPDKQNPVVQVFSRLYARASEAYKRKDLSVFMAMTASDFHVKMPDGQMLDSAQARAVMRRQLATFKEIKEMKVVVDRVELTGNTAIVHSTQRVSVVLTGQNNTRHTIEQSSKGEDRWLKTPNGWRVQLSEEISHKVMVDGKPAESWDKKSGRAGR